MKINKIRIENFKVFQNSIFDFESSDLIVFDGPNGFGKTSIYDAIELLFTGKIRRFDDLKNRVVDGRETFSEHPFLCDYADGDISITIDFSKGEFNHILERRAIKNQLTNLIDFSLYKLYEKTDFLSEERKEIENEEAYLIEILAKNYKENFQFLNYIEQEDSIYLLKNHDKNRKQNISHLFNVEEFEDRITKIEKLKGKIYELCTPEKQSEIVSLKETIRKNEEFLSNEFNNVQFERLFGDKGIPWDQEHFNFQNISFENLFDEDGIIPRLKKFLENKVYFKRYIRNEKINLLIGEKKEIESFLLYYHFLPLREQLSKQNKEVEKINQLATILKEFSVENIKNESFENEFDDFEFLNELKLTFKEGYEILIKNSNELDGIEKIYSEIKESRDKLFESIKSLQEEKTETTGNCFLCGYDWTDLDNLLEKITAQTISLEELSSAKSKKFNDDLTKFKFETITPIINALNLRIEDIKIDIKFIGNFLSTDEVQLNKIKKEFESIEFGYQEYLNKMQSMDGKIDIENIIIPKLESLKSEIDILGIETYFKEIFTHYFDNRFENIDKLEIENITNKEKFLKYQYSLLQSEILQKSKEDLQAKEAKFNNAKKLESDLKELNKIYKKSLKDYQNKVIKDIEIIFHIYSGRILQDFQGGLGLFIFSDKDGIRFQTNPVKTFDAIFSMSSGQLSALIISFTLALHKKYSKNEIILIDDPVQTMDEINMVGFIELLRNEFKTNQFIISTHEDMTSVFMRYKFKSYGLSQKRINLKVNQN